MAGTGAPQAPIHVSGYALELIPRTVSASGSYAFEGKSDVYIGDVTFGPEDEPDNNNPDPTSPRSVPLHYGH